MSYSLSKLYNHELLQRSNSKICTFLQSGSQNIHVNVSSIRHGTEQKRTKLYRFHAKVFFHVLHNFFHHFCVVFDQF